MRDNDFRLSIFDIRLMYTSHIRRLKLFYTYIDVVYTCNHNIRRASPRSKTIFPCRSEFDKCGFLQSKTPSPSLIYLVTNHGKSFSHQNCLFTLEETRDWKNFHETCSSSSVICSFSQMLPDCSVDVVLPYTTPFDIIRTVFFKACLLLQNQILITSLSYPNRCAKVVISLPTEKKKRRIETSNVLRCTKQLRRRISKLLLIAKGLIVTDRRKTELTGRMSVPVKMCVQQFQSLGRKGGPPFPLLARFDPDEVRQMINAALVPGIRCTTLAQIRKIALSALYVNVTAQRARARVVPS